MQSITHTTGRVKMKLLDLFCGAGGCAVGYYRAGFYDITGVDIAPQKNYPYKFIQADALAYLAAHGHEYDFIHASPPCQAYSITSNMSWVGEYPQLVEPVRTQLQTIGKPYVIENVPGAPLQDYVTLCGTMFGLQLFRHRLFETSFFLLGIPHIKHSDQIGKNGYVCMAGHGDSGRGRIPADHRSVGAWKKASHIDWMTMAEMAQAIPPAYTEWIGQQYLQSLGGA